MKTYRIIKTSLWLSFFTMLAFILGSISFWRYLSATFGLETNQLTTIVIIALLLFTANWLTRYTASAVFDIDINKDGLKLRWVRQFLFLSKKSLEIAWTEVYRYDIEEHQFYSSFKFVLRNGESFSFWHANRDKKRDDFDAFVFQFSAYVNKTNDKIEKYNQQALKDKSKKRINIEKIKPAEKFHETEEGFVLAILAGICLIIIVIAIAYRLLFGEQEINAGFFFMLSSVIGAFLYIHKVYQYHKVKNKTNND